MASVKLRSEKKNQFLDYFKKGIDKEGILCSIIGPCCREREVWDSSRL